MEKIIDPISKDKLVHDLKSCRFIKKTNKSENEIYSFSYQNELSLKYEVGRLRETAFRLVGCSSGNIIDLDDHDMKPVSFMDHYYGDRKRLINDIYSEKYNRYVRMSNRNEHIFN